MTSNEKQMLNTSDGRGTFDNIVVIKGLIVLIKGSEKFDDFFHYSNNPIF